MKTVKFFTLGCKVNQYETQLLREQFLSLGYRETNDHARVDICVINTCTVTQTADSESFYAIRKARRDNPTAKIIVTGCLAQLDAEKIKEKEKVDFVVKNQDKDKLVNKISHPSVKIKSITHFAKHSRAFLKIQDGCDNFCSYCKVPFVRGKPRSRFPEDIVNEAEGLTRNGIKEIVLTGICLGAYGRDLEPKMDIAELIGNLENIEGLLRIRLSSIEPIDVTDRLIKKIKYSEKFCKHLHIPLQSGDDQMLKRMNRHYSGDDYLNLIKKIKRIVGGISITTDIIVGFPGEEEKNFCNTLELVKKIMPLRIHIFPYSRREGTAAAIFKEQNNHLVIKERILRLKDLASICFRKYSSQFLDKRLAVLIEQKVKERPGFWEGYSDNYIRVIVRSNRNLHNQLVRLKLKKLENETSLATFN